MVVLQSLPVRVCPLTGCPIDERFLVSHRLRLLVPLAKHGATYKTDDFCNYRTVARSDGRFLLIMYVGDLSSVDETKKAFFCLEAEGRDDQERDAAHAAFKALRVEDVQLRTFADLIDHIDCTFDRVIINAVSPVDERGCMEVYVRFIRPRQ